MTVCQSKPGTQFIKVCANISLCYIVMLILSQENIYLQMSTFSGFIIHLFLI